MRTIDWDLATAEVVMVDQSALPADEIWMRIREVDVLLEAIGSLRVRGAMALGAAGALGVALAACRAEERSENLTASVNLAAEALIASRPTAVNLSVGVRETVAALPGGCASIVARALQLLRDDEVINERMSRRGAQVVTELTGKEREIRLLTHCNAGALAAVDWGSAVGVIRALHEGAGVDLVYSSETRPLLQGARLTAWELERMAVPFKVAVDGAGASLLLGGAVDAVLVGADRIAANGDTANKIGTLAHAAAAHTAGIPFIVVAPESTVDHDTPAGQDIPIEQRGAGEVSDRFPVWNPAFDVTPAELITAIVTEERVWVPREAPQR